MFARFSMYFSCPLSSVGREKSRKKVGFLTFFWRPKPGQEDRNWRYQKWKNRSFVWACACLNVFKLRVCTFFDVFQLSLVVRWSRKKSDKSRFFDVFEGQNGAKKTENTEKSEPRTVKNTQFPWYARAFICSGTILLRFLMVFNIFHLTFDQKKLVKKSVFSDQNRPKSQKGTTKGHFGNQNLHSHQRPYT